MPIAAANYPRLASVFHALSDETRLGIIGQLRRGERCVCELTGALNAAQSRLSFHLKVLRDAGIVSDRRDGRWIYYTLREDTLAEARKVLDTLEADAAACAKGCC